MTPLLTLPSLEAEQCNLPGLPSFLLTAAPLVPQPAEKVSFVSPDTHSSSDQLSFEANQEPLSETPASPCQLPLLPDPPVWEMGPVAPAPKSRKGRLARKRTNLGLSPGQMSLF